MALDRQKVGRSDNTKTIYHLFEQGTINLPVTTTAEKFVIQCNDHGTVNTTVD